MTLASIKPNAENIVTLNPISWDTFNTILTELGNQRGQLLTYYQGTLEIMSPLGQHENNNRFIDDMIRIMADELNLNLKKLGSLTLKSPSLKQAIEPDSCYYLENEPSVRNKQNIDLTIDPPPDLVLEIDITSGSLHKLPIYADFGVPEVWRYDGKTLRVFILDGKVNTYLEVNHSRVFPFLALSMIPELINESLSIGETAVFKKFRQYIKDINTPFHGTI